MAKIVTAQYALDLIYPPLDNMTDEERYSLCAQNKHLSIERDEHQQILFLPPVAESLIKLVEVMTDLVFGTVN